MEQSRELIVEIKEIRQAKRINYDEILEALTINGIPTVSKTTLRRVFADGSEDRACNFNYERTLLPIAEAIRKLNGETPHMRQIELLMDQIIDRDKRISRLVDRLDAKDEIIRQLLFDMRQKDEMIQCLTKDLYENSKDRPT